MANNKNRFSKYKSKDLKTIIFVKQILVIVKTKYRIGFQYC